MTTNLPRAKSFHEKAGSCQDGFVVAFDRRVVFPGTHPLLPPSFHPHSLLSECSLGASWAFSFQQVLLPVNRPRPRSLGPEWGQDLARSHLNSAVVLDNPNSFYATAPTAARWLRKGS